MQPTPNVERKKKTNKETNKKGPKMKKPLLPLLLTLLILSPIKAKATQEALDLCEREQTLLTRAVAAECPTASLGVQTSLAQTILHRLESGKFGENLTCVIYTADFLNCIKTGRITLDLPQEILQQAACAVNIALSGGDPADGALYFASPENTMSPPAYITYREDGYIFGKR